MSTGFAAVAAVGYGQQPYSDDGDLTVSCEMRLIFSPRLAMVPSTVLL
jgi:hypothetical protein